MKSALVSATHTHTHIRASHPPTTSTTGSGLLSRSLLVSAIFSSLCCHGPEDIGLDVETRLEPQDSSSLKLMN